MSLHIAKITARFPRINSEVRDVKSLTLSQWTQVEFSIPNFPMAIRWRSDDTEIVSLRMEENVCIVKGKKEGFCHLLLEYKNDLRRIEIFVVPEIPNSLNENHK